MGRDEDDVSKQRGGHFVNKPESATLSVSVADAKVRKRELGGGAERTGWT